MKLLLDTHILIWTLKGNEKKLPVEARQLIENEENEIFYSNLSIFEIELKRVTRPDKMPAIGEEVLSHCENAGFIRLDLNISHILAFKNLKRFDYAPPHNDPFDKLMLCQAIVEEMTFMTHDKRIAEYDTRFVYKV